MAKAKSSCSRACGSEAYENKTLLENVPLETLTEMFIWSVLGNKDHKLEFALTVHLADTLTKEEIKNFIGAKAK